MNISLSTRIIVIRKLILVKSICVTFILVACLYQVEPAPAYQASAQNDNRTNSQPAPSIEKPLSNPKASPSPDQTKPAEHNMTSAEKWQLLIFGATGLFILWQAWTYQKQRQIMQGQLDITRELKTITEKQSETSDAQAKEQLDVMQKQFDAMERQGNLMSESLAETRNIVAQNERTVIAVEIQAEASQTSAKAVAGQGDTMKDQLTAMKAQEGAMKGQLDIMRDTLAESKRVFDLTERPIIVVEQAAIDDLTTNRPLMPAITIANRGRTAAKRLIITIRAFAKMNWDLTKEIPDSKPTPAHIYFLPAGGTIKINGHDGDAIHLDEDLYRGIVDGNQFCVIYVSGTYRNLSGDREYPIDEYVFSYYAGDEGFVLHSYHMASIEKRKEQSTTAGKKQEDPN